MARRLLGKEMAEPISPFIDVVFNGMAAMFILFMVYMVVVQPSEPLQFLNTPMTIGVLGQPYFFAFSVTGGSGSRKFSIIDGQLPEGLRLDTATGLVHGVPTISDGDSIETHGYAITVVVEDNNYIDTMAFEFNIYPGALPYNQSENHLVLIRSNEELRPARVGMQYEEVIGALGGIEPYTWTMEGLPPGLMIENGRIFGSPQKPGKYIFNATVAHTAGSFSHNSKRFKWSAADTQANYKMTVLNQPKHRLNLPVARADEEYLGLVISYGLLPEDRIEWRSDVPGLRVTNDATLEGIPTNPGVYSIQYWIINREDTVGRGSGKLRVLPKKQEKSVGNVFLQLWEGEQVIYDIPYKGMEEPVTVDAQGPLPNGLEIIRAQVVGMPRETSMRTVPILAKDATGDSVSGKLGIRIGRKSQPLAIVSPDTLRLIVGSEIQWTPAASGGEGNYKWSMKGQIPMGLKFENNILRGMVDQPNTWNMTLSAKDRITDSIVTKELYVVGIPADTTKPTVETKRVPAAIVNKPYHVDLASAGGIGNLKWILKEMEPLPPGLRLTENGITGNADSADSSSITVSVVDELGQQDGPYILSVRAVDPAQELRRQLAEALDSIQSQYLYIEELNRIRKIKEESIVSLESQLEKLRVELKEFQNRMKYRGERIQELDSIILDRNDSISSLTVQLKETQMQLELFNIDKNSISVTEEHSFRDNRKWPFAIAIIALILIAILLLLYYISKRYKAKQEQEHRSSGGRKAQS